MNANRLADKLHKMAEEYKTKGDDEKLDYYDRSFNKGLSMGLLTAQKELLENMIKGDIK